MAQTQIGAQLYTLREHCKTPSDMAKTFKKLADIGFKAVQVSALGPVETTELKKMLDDHGLVCAATHASLDEMRDTEKVLDHHRILGCELTAIGGFGGRSAQTRAEWGQFIKDYNAVAGTLAPKGLRVGYHNHSHEWATFDGPSLNAERPIDLLEKNLDPSVWFELDTYWVTHGGGDPAAWLTRLANTGKDRLPAIHVKDMAISPAREQKMCEVGSGNLNWPAILDAARKADVRWYLIERDRGDLDPFESLKISLENMQQMGLS